jgi:hypothetical protein
LIAELVGTYVKSFTSIDERMVHVNVLAPPRVVPCFACTVKLWTPPASPA